MSFSTLIWSIPDRLVSVMSKAALLWTANRRPIIIGTLVATLGAGSLALLYISQKKIAAGGATSSILSDTEKTPTHNYENTLYSQGDVTTEEDAPQSTPDKVECAHFDAIVPVAEQAIVPVAEQAIVPVPEEPIVPLPEPTHTPYSVLNQSIVSSIEMGRSSVTSPSTEYYSVQDNSSVSTTSATLPDGSFYTAPIDASSQSLGGITTEDEMLPEADEFDRATPEPGQETSKREESTFLGSSVSEEVISDTISNINDLPSDSLSETEVRTMRGYLLNLHDVIVKNPLSAKDRTAFHLWSRVVMWLGRVTSDSPHATRLLHDAGITEDLSTQFIGVCKDVNHEMTSLISQSEMAALIRTFSALTQHHLLSQRDTSTKSVSGPEATYWMLFKATMNQIWQTMLLPLDQLPVDLSSKSTAKEDTQVIPMSLGWNTGRDIQLSALEFISNIITCAVDEKTHQFSAQFRDLLFSVALPSQQKNLRCLLSLALPRPESQPNGFPEPEDAQEGQNELRSTALKCLIHVSQAILFESHDNASGDISITHKGPLMILNVKNMPSSISILLKRALLVHPHESQYSLHDGWLQLLANLLHCVVTCVEAKKGDLLVQKESEVDGNREGDSENMESLRPFRSFFTALLYTRQDLQASAALLVTRGDSMEVRMLASEVVNLLESMSSLC